MSDSPARGYLVVLKDPLAWAARPENVLNPLYRGVWRVPTWPSDYVEENAPLEAMIFTVADRRGFIPTISQARLLLAELSLSGRSFEVLYCEEVVDGATADSADGPSRVLGYDVAGRDGDHWSIVADFPHDPEARDLLGRLNENGLFSSFADASRLLTMYKERQLPDWDIPFAVFRVDLDQP